MSCLLWGGVAVVAGWGIEEMRIRCWNNLKKYEFNAETIWGNIERGEKTFWRRCGTIDTSANKIPPLSLAQTCNTQTYAIPPLTRQHCRLSICRYFGIWQNQKQIKNNLMMRRAGLSTSYSSSPKKTQAIHTIHRLTHYPIIFGVFDHCRGVSAKHTSSFILCKQNGFSYS